MRPSVAAYIMALAVIGSGHVASAEECQAGRTTVFFINGVWRASLEDADSGRQELENVVRSRLADVGGSTSPCVHFKLSYNAFEVYVGDLIEAAVQTLLGEMAHFWRWWAHLEFAPEWFQDLFQRLSEFPDLAAYLVDGDLQQHVATYLAALAEGDSIVLVGHSQGALYANAAHGRLTGAGGVDSRRIRVVAVATPASFVAGDGPHATLYEDLIASVAFRIAHEDRLPSNVTNLSPFCLFDAFCHDFRNSYLLGLESRVRIVDHVLGPPTDNALLEISGTASTSPVWGQGVVTATDLIGQRYLPTRSESVCSVSQRMARSGNPTDGVTLTVFEGGGIPGQGMVRWRRLHRPVTIPHSPERYTEFAISPCLSLSAGTPYWFQWSSSSPDGSGGYRSMYRESSEFPNSSYWQLNPPAVIPPGWTEYPREWSFRLAGEVVDAATFFEVPGTTVVGHVWGGSSGIESIAESYAPDEDQVVCSVGHRVERSGDASGTLNLKVYEGGPEAGPVLASSTVDMADVPTDSRTETVFQLDHCMPLVEGHTYFLTWARSQREEFPRALRSRRNSGDRLPITSGWIRVGGWRENDEREEWSLRLIGPRQ